MKKLILIHLFVCLGIVSQAQSAYQEIREGNDLFKNNAFEEATKKYQESMAKDVEPVESSYNIGNALYRQEKYKDAARYFNQAANKTEDKAVRSNAYHNLGNALLKEKKLEESVKAYKRSLLNNPQNEESRYNLAYAQKMLQQQQQQQKEQEKENKEDQENKDEEKKDEQNKEDQNKDEGDKDEEKKEEEQKNEEEKEKEEKEKQEKQKQQQQEKQVSREDAERILEALNQKEKELQEKLKKKKLKGVKIEIEKDW